MSEDSGDAHGEPPRADAGAPGLTRRALSGGLWVSLGMVVQTVLRVLVISILARLLGPSEFGLAAAATIVTAFCLIFLQAGVRPAVIQRPDLQPRHVRAAFWLAIAIGAIVAGSVVWAAPSIASRAFDMPDLTPVLRVVCVLVPIQSLGIVAESLLERNLRFDWLVRLEVSAYFAGYAGVGIGLALAGYGVWALVGAYLVQQLVMSTGALLVQPHPKAVSLERGAVRELVGTGAGFSLGRMLHWGAVEGDKWVAGRFVGQEGLGLYKYAYDLTNHVSNIFARVLDRVLFPSMARVQAEPERLARAYRLGLSLIVVALLPISAALVVLAPEIVRILLGDAWGAAVAPFQVLALAITLRASSRMSDSLARAAGAVYRRAWRQGVYAATVISLAWIGHHWGLVGLALGAAVGVAVNFALMGQLSTRLAGLSWRQLLASLLGALPAFLLAGAAFGGGAQLARACELAAPLVVAISLVLGGLALLAALSLSPRVLLGADGSDAVGLLLGFARERFPAVFELRAVKPFARHWPRRSG